MNINIFKLKFRARKAKVLGMIAFALISATIGAAVLPMGVSADGPQFNFMSGDFKLLNVANRTTGSGWQNNGVSANANDSVAFQVYYHNGYVGTTANNTKIRLTFPTTAQNIITVGSTLGADNAATISDNVIINSSVAQTLNINTASVLWYPNRSQTPTTISATSVGNGYVEVNIGSIQGCWEYQGYVTFTGTLTPTVNPIGNLSIQKTVRNITSGVGYTETVNANNNDQIGFQMQIQNTGNAVLNNVLVRDVLPSGLSYISGSTRQDGNYVSDGIAGGNINIGSLAIGAVRTVTFSATVNSGASQTLTNYAYASADSVSERNDTAGVYVNQVNPIGNLSIQKTVRNITSGTSLASSVNAVGGDRVSFSIQVNAINSGAQVNNVRVSDVLPSGLNYVSGSTRVDGSFIGDGLISGGLNLGSMFSGQIKNITFEATVSSGLANQILTNFAYASGDNIGQVSSSAQVVVGGTPINNNANLVKNVANLTWPNGSNTDNQAHIGDTLQYTLTFTNNTGAILNNVQILDVLPSFARFNNASNNGIFSASSNSINWNIGSMSQGQTVTVIYQASVLSVPSDNFVITNSALARASSLNDIISNETHTTVVGVIKGAVIKAVTGGNDLTRNIGLALIVAIWGMFAAYLIAEYPEFWRGLGLKLKTLKIKFTER